MEAAAHGGGGGGAEVRRLHIVYFLSRKGRIEHPHLVRVHHLSRNGVRLRDIKRWLGKIRGKDMPESFSWSYKRRYKTGYVWQDLMDDDLITPISDNEYVLKGSEIASTIIKEEKSAQQLDQKALSREENHSHSSETSIYMSTKSSEIEEEESPTSTLTDDSGEIEMDKGKHEKQDENPSLEEKTQRSSTFYSALLSKKNKKKSNSSKVKFEEKVSIAEAADSLKTTTTSSSSSEPHLTKSKSSSNGGSNIFRNLITCGAVETNDSAVVAVNKQNSNNNKPFLSMCSSDLENVYSAELCKRDRIGGSQRVFGTPNWTQEKWGGRKSFDGVKVSVKNKSESKEQKANDKQVNWPHCSQCGKPFKPEKLHSHMKSCKGMKALKKENAAIFAAAAAEKASRNKISGIPN